jgi:hypothetical protein
MADDELKLRITPEVDEDALKRAQAEIDGISGKVNLGGKGKGSGGADAISNAIKRDIQTRIDLRDLELRRIQTASAEEIKFLQQRAAQGKITTTQMVADIQLVENAQEVATQNALKDYNALQSEIMRTTELTKAQATALEKKLFFAQERASTGFVSMSRSMGGLQSSTKDANIAFANFGRIVQDAPFGLLGLSNNIDPLLQSFAQLKASAGGTGLALRSMGATLMGPAGLIFLLGSLLPTALLFAQKAMAKSKKETDDATDSLTEYERALRSASQTQVSDAIPSTLTYAQQIEALNTALMSASTSIGIQNLEIVNASQFFKNGAVDLLGYTRAQERLSAMTTETRQALAGASQEVFGATIQEDEAVREIIQSKINEAKANQAIEDALKRLNITRRKSAEEIEKERLDAIDADRRLREARWGTIFVLTNAFRRSEAEMFQMRTESMQKQADAEFANATRVGEGELDITRRTILARTQLYKEGEQVISDAMTTGSKLRVMLLENEQQGLIEMMDLSTSIARNAFGDTKAVAVAEALVNTYVGVSRALREYAPPLSGIMAGLQLANGLATVDRIRRTQIGSAPSGGGGAVNQSASIASATQKPFVTDAISPSGANIAGRIGAMNNQPQFNVTATVDRMGLALAVRDGESDISTRQIPFAS